MTQQAVNDATAARATSAADEPAGRHPTAGETVTAGEAEKYHQEKQKEER